MAYGLSGKLGRWIGAVVACLVLAGPVAARQATTAAAPTPANYAECMRLYAARTDAATSCRRRFPETAAPAVDITPQLKALLERLAKAKPAQAAPADPLAVVPAIQAACAPLAANVERWRRCVTEGWRGTGLPGRPPLVLQTPPEVTKPPAPPPMVEPVKPVEPVATKPEAPAPPVASPSPEPVAPPPPVAVSAPSPPVQPLPLPPPPKPTVPIWLWLVGLGAAAVGGFGLAKMLTRARPPTVQPACAPDIALVADPGVVVLTRDGPPRAGMAVSMRFDRAPDADAIRLDYPTLEATP